MLDIYTCIVGVATYVCGFVFYVYFGEYLKVDRTGTPLLATSVFFAAFINAAIVVHGFEAPIVFQWIVSPFIVMFILKATYVIHQRQQSDSRIDSYASD